MSTVQDNRIKWIDIAKGIGILLVIFCHLTNLFEEQFVNVLIFSFHMPLFFFLSGFVFSNKRSFKDFALRKFRTIYIPYILFLSIDFFLYFIMHFKSANIIDMGVSFCMHLIGFDFSQSAYFFNVPIWFLCVLFFAEILFYFISKLNNIFLVFISFGCLVLVNFVDFKLPFSLSHVLAAIIFISLGYFAKTQYTCVKKFKSINSRIFCMLGFIILFIVLLLSNILFHNKVAMDRFIYGNVFLFFINAVIGILMVYFLSVLLQDFKLLSFFGTNSIVILCVHFYFCRKLIPFIFNCIGLGPSILYNFFVEIALMVAVSVVLIPIILVVNKYLFFIFGRTPNKSRV